MTAHENLERLRQQTLELDRGIRLLDDGDATGLNVIAGRLRVLLVRDRGGRLLQRVAQDQAVELEPIRIGAPAPSEIPGWEGPLPDGALTFSELTSLLIRLSGGPLPVTFAIGALPAGAVRSLVDDEALEVDPNQFLVQRVTSVWTGSRVETFTWEELLREVANKLGAAHSDDDVLAAFDRLAQETFLERTALEMALRSAAVVTSAWAHAVLSAVNPAHVAPSHSLELRGHGVRAQFHARLNAGLPGSAILVAQGGMTLRGENTPDATSTKDPPESEAS